MSEAERFLNEHTAEIEPLMRDYNLKYWNASVSGRSEDSALSAEAKERYLRVYARPDEFARVTRLDATPDPDPVVARQIHLVKLQYEGRQMDPEVLADIVRREEEIEVQFNTFRASLDGRRVTDNDLKKIFRQETDLEVRARAWEASKQIGAEVESRLLDLVKLRNREARRLGHRDYYAMSLKLQEFDEAGLLGILDELREITTEPFRAMKGELDGMLANRYGVTSFEPYPWMYGDPFFQDAPPGAAEVDLDQLFRSKDIEALTLRTYNGLNLPVADLLPRSDLHEKDGKCQHAFCAHIDRKGDVRVLCNVKPDEYWMSTMLHEFGHAVYDKYVDMDLPFLLRTPAHISTTEAVAMFMGRLTRNPEWLCAVVGISEHEAKKLKTEIAKALRTQMLIFVRWGLLVVNFERELYRDPDQDLNGLWWRMASEFQMITPPPGRSRPDWASKIHFCAAPVYYENYILGELTASQFETTVRRQLVKSPGEKSSYVDRPQAGAFLKDKLFKLGALHDWQETLRQVTGEPLNPSHFVKQFVSAP